MSNPESIVNISNVRKPGYKKKRLNLIISLIVFVIIIIGAYIYISPSKNEYYLKDYTTEIVKVKDIQKSVSITGTIKIYKKESLSSISDGICTKVLKFTGDEILEDEPILVLESEELKDEKNSIENDLKKLKREILINNQELSRKERNIKRVLEKQKISIDKSINDLKEAKELLKLNSITQKDYEGYEEVLDQKKLELEDLEISSNDLKQDIELAKYLSDYDLENILLRLEKVDKKIDLLTTKSSFKGTLLDLKIKQGEKVSKGSILAEIGDLNTAYIESYIPIKYSEDIHEGTDVLLTYDNKKYNGRVTQINSFVTVGSNGEKLLYCEIKITDEFEKYILGSNIGCELIISDIKNQLTLSRGEYIISGKNRFLYLVEGDKAVKKPVKYGVINNTLVSIINGVKSGDKIITSSYEDFIERDEIYLK